MAGAKKKAPEDDFGFKEEPAAKAKPAEDDFGFKEEPVDLLKKFNEAGHKVAEPGFFRDTLYGLSHAANKVTGGNLEYSDKFKNELQAGERDSPGSSRLGKGAGMVGLAGMSMASPVNPYLTAAIQGAASKPEGERTPGNDIVARAVQAVAAPVVAKGLGVVGSGLRKGGDYAMQKAVGAREYIAGMGERLANEGLWGSKGMMQNQVAKKLPLREADLNKAVAQVMGDVPPAPVAKAIEGEAAPYIPKPGASGPMPLPSGSKPYVDLSTARAEEAMARGTITPAEAISVARAVSKPAYGKTGEPLDAFKHQVSQTEGIALKDQVKALADAQKIPGVRKALASEQALIHARNSMDRPMPLAENIRRHLYRTAFGGLGLGLGGVPGAVAGYGASTPFGLSVLGQGLIKGGQLTPKLSPMAIDALVKKSMEADKK